MPSRHLLVLDSAYTYGVLTGQGLAVLVTHRDLDGYFTHVWTVHPVASLFEAQESAKYGSPVVRTLNDRHTFIEGKIGRFAWLRWLPPLNLLLAQVQLVRMLARLVRTERIDVVRSEEPLYNGLLTIVISAMCRIPAMVAMWGNHVAIRAHTGRPLMRRFFRWVWLEALVERWVLRRADAVLVQNQDNLRCVVGCGVPPERVAIFRLGNAVHKAHFLPPAERAGGRDELRDLGIADEKLLLCISRLEALKLTDHVVHVVAHLRDRGWNVKALFAGEGTLRPEMEALGARLGVADRLLFLGNRSQEWLSRVIPYVSAVVSPLTGRALVEAALGGAALVAYDIDWHGEFVETGVTGELVPHLDHAAMADAVERILRDDEYRRKLGAGARQRALEFSDPASIRGAQIAVYEELLSSHRQRPVSELVSHG